MSKSDLDVRTPTNWTAIGIGLLVALIVLSGVGTIGHLSGAGWFGYRVWLYEGGELYALNLSAKPLWVVVDGGERVEIPPENAQIVDLLGGTSTVTVSDEQQVLATHSVTVDKSHAFLKLTSDGCLAVVDITPFYEGTAGDELDFEAFLREDARVWIPRSRNIAWPRKDFPSRLEGGEGDGFWFEIVGCELLDEPIFLDAYLAVRLENRMAAALGKKKK